MKPQPERTAGDLNESAERAQPPLPRASTGISGFQKAVRIDEAAATNEVIVLDRKRGVRDTIPDVRFNENEDLRVSLKALEIELLSLGIPLKARPGEPDHPYVMTHQGRLYVTWTANRGYLLETPTAQHHIEIGDHALRAADCILFATYASLDEPDIWTMLKYVLEFRENQREILRMPPREPTLGSQRLDF